MREPEHYIIKHNKQRSFTLGVGSVGLAVSMGFVGLTTFINFIVCAVVFIESAWLGLVLSSIAFVGQLKLLHVLLTAYKTTRASQATASYERFLLRETLAESGQLVGGLSESHELGDSQDGQLSLSQEQGALEMVQPAGAREPKR